MAANIDLLLLFSFFIFPILGQLLGGWNQAEVNDESIQDVAQFVLTTINQRSNSLYLSKMVEVIRAERQVVAGMKYKLQIRIGTTSCRKGRDDGKDLATECDLNNGGVQVCAVEVFNPAGTNTKRLESFNCNADSVDHGVSVSTTLEPKRTTGPMPGGKLQINQESTEVQNALAFAVEELNKRHDQPKRAMISDVISAHSQVVAGVKYTIKLHLSPSICDNNEQNLGATITQCPIARKPEVEECQIEVLFQAWMTPSYQLLDPISCKLKANPLYYKDKLLGRKNLKTKHADATMNQSENEVVKPLYGNGDDHDVASWGAFAQYMEDYNKVYADRKEMKERYKIFHRNMKKANQFMESEEGTAVYGPNEFSDMSEEEFLRYYRNPVWDTSYDPSLQPAEIPEDPAPASFDWRDHNAVTEVKNQGMCGSCWAFSTTGNIEGQWAIQKGKLISLSEQELVDCDKLDEGCEGGLPSNAYKEIRRLGGLETEKQYPYEGEDDKCTFKPSESRVYINGSLNITKDEGEMAQWLAKNGPISIGINANMMQFYLGGVSHPWKIFCNPESLDHGVLIVGYGTKKGFFSDTPYWIVKNSWGASWGEKGYYLVYRGDGTCGLNQMCTSAQIN